LTEKREDIYDSQIDPLIEKIIEICNENSISMVASFHTPNDESQGLICSTFLVDREDVPRVFVDICTLLLGSKSVETSKILQFPVGGKKVQ